MIGKTVLLDTSIIIEYLRQKDKEKTTLYLLAEEQNNFAISIVTHTEVYSGKSVWESKKAQTTIEVLLEEIIILKLDESISREAGKVRAKYNTNIIDAIIAATAIQHQLPLATLNTKDFKPIKGLKLLPSA